MKKYITVILFAMFSVAVSAQEKVQKTDQQNSGEVQKAAEQNVKKSNEVDFQAQKTQEAKEKQEAMRKAMKEKAKTKEQQNRSR